MEISIIIGLVICLAITNPVKSGGGTGWQAISPSEWNSVYPACRGNNQSPINIITSNTVYDDQLEDFVLHNYYREVQWNVSFDTFSISFVPVYPSSKESAKIAVSGSNFDDKFYLANFHFHWGPRLRGSEHRVNGRKYDFEVHLVHAKADSSAYTVLGFFVEIDRNLKSELTPIFRTFKKLMGSDNKLTAGIYKTARFSLKSLLNNIEEIKQSGYYRYPGSLTVPPCTEGIIWNVFKNPITISAESASLFNGDDNVAFRPVQPLNGRVVNRSF